MKFTLPFRRKLRERMETVAPKDPPGIVCCPTCEAVSSPFDNYLIHKAGCNNTLPLVIRDTDV